MATSGEPKVAESGTESRLSSLPDDIVAHILSFLETKYAVGTAVLSRRWKDLWKRVSNLDLDNRLVYRDLVSSGGNLYMFEVLKRSHLEFSRFVDRVLSLHINLDSLRRFRFQFMPWEADCNVMQDFVDKMGLVFGSRLEEIDIKLRYVGSAEPWLLPESFYTMKNLKVAKLDGFTMTAIGNYQYVSLPRLKILLLESVETKNLESLGKLISGCPVLESLGLEFCYSEDSNEDDILTASLPSLRNLTIIDYAETDNVLCHIAMEAPKLEHLCLEHFPGLELLGGSTPLPCLYSAEIKPDHSGGSYGGLIRLLTRISNAKKMCFNVHALEILTSGAEDIQLPAFPNLTRLEVEPGSRSWILHSLLHSAPKLQSLVINVGTYIYAPLMWEGTEPTKCLLSSLEEIEIKGFGPFDSDMEMAGGLLNVGAVLKKVDIGLFGDPTKEQRRELRSLLKLPRGSSACDVRLLLRGREIDVSIDDDEINTDSKDETDLNDEDEDRF